jgi:PAS domain S-box-containing protein
MNYQDKTKEQLIQELQDLQNKYNSIIKLYEKDISVQKQTETALKKSQLLLNETGKIAKVGGWEFDVKTFEQVWTEEIFNILEIDISYGAPKVEQGIQFFAPSSKQIAEQAVQRAIEFGEPYDLEVEIITTKGKYRWVRSIGKANYENGEIVSISGIFQDITELKQTEILKQRNVDIENENEKIKQLNEEIKAAEEKMKNTFNLSPSIISTANLNSNCFIGANPAVTRILGYTIEEFTSTPIIELIHPDDRQRTIDEIAIQIKGQEITSFENRYLCKDGSYKWMAWHGTKADKNGIVIAIGTDINERKCAEIELIKAKEKVEESDRLKTTFLQNMSHEIRTPLNAISGFSGMLNKTDLSDEKRKSFVSIIQNNSKQLISIVSDILTISSLETKQEKLSIDKVCINNIIVELLAIFKQQAQNQNISIYAKQQLSDKQTEIYTDKIKVTQILTNLLTNAIKFTYEGFIEFGYNLKDYEFEFYVKDSGIGIKPEMHEKIFERFRQADKAIDKLYGGTGLGLAISKAFTELLGGKIWVQSELEKGSTFYFTIPYRPVNEIDQSTSPNIQNENFRTVLVAEDEECNFLYIEAVLIDLDLKLIHAKNGRETIEIFKSNPNIDLILMDIKMPIMTGYDAATIIKELKPELPIIAQSAYALEHERAKYEGIFDDYLTKPINEDYLKQMVMKYIDKPIN